jgi:AraC family transcriptional regulator
MTTALAHRHSVGLLQTALVTATDERCPGVQRGWADGKRSPSTLISFPYRGVHIRAVGVRRHVAEPNQVTIVNADEPYRVGHPVPGGHAALTIALEPAMLPEVAPAALRHPSGAVNVPGLRIDSATQLLAAQLRQRLSAGSIGRLEAETHIVQLVRLALRGAPARASDSPSGRPERLVDHVKLLLSADPWRRWTLTEIAERVSVTPVYLTDAFRRIEGLPLYRYHLRLRLAVALGALGDCDDLTRLAIELGFSSHSHFTSTFRKSFGQTPSEFKRSIKGLPMPGADSTAKDRDSATRCVARIIDPDRAHRPLSLMPATVVA